MPFIFLLFPIAVSALLVLFIFLYFLFTGKQILSKLYLTLEVISLALAPFLYLAVLDMEQINDCCGDSAVFSPEHRLTIYALILVCLTAYFYSGFRKVIATPVIEIITNSLLLTGIVLNVILLIHIEPWLAILGNVPVILLFILMLVKNQRRLIEQIQEMEIQPRNGISRLALKILLLNPIIKIPILFVFCLPVLAIFTALLLLIGQKPDSMIRAFTDTYHHGFSKLDYMCNNVECGGHFLCSVAAKGHKGFVKPTRLGIRNEQLILCNRQLLVSNAFEDLLQQKLPFLHKPIRQSYNRVGNVIHRYYTIFNNKWVCDAVYVIMKPAEWFFLLALYTFDKTPENRIAKQYISRSHRSQLEVQA